MKNFTIIAEGTLVIFHILVQYKYIREKNAYRQQFQSVQGDNPVIMIGCQQ